MRQFSVVGGAADGGVSSLSSRESPGPGCRLEAPGQGRTPRLSGADRAELGKTGERPGSGPWPPWSPWCGSGHSAGQH